jgi:hypothetical protein
VSRSTRLELLQERYDELEAKKNQLSATIVELASMEDEAAYTAVKQAPTRSPFSLGSDAQRARDRRAKVEKELTAVESNLTAVTRALVEQQALAADERLAAVVTEAGKFTPAEIEGWKKAGRLLAELHEVWLSEIVGNYEQRRALGAELERSGTLQGRDEGLKARLSDALTPPIQPLDGDFAGFFQSILKAATDPDVRSGWPGARIDSAGRLPGLVEPFGTRRVEAGGDIRWSDRPTAMGNQPPSAVGVEPENTHEAAKEAAAELLAEVEA